MNHCPRIEINLDKIRQNASILKKLYGNKGIQITGVTKGVCSSPEVAKILVETGISSLADSKITNIIKMKKANINATFILLRTPAMSEINKVVRYADISMNSELDVIKALSAEAVRRGRIHRIIIMVEMGDLREGILLKDGSSFIGSVSELPGVQIVGIGTNFACYSGNLPTEKSMREFTGFVRSMQKQFHLILPYVSGGNSANFDWMMHTKDAGAVNNIRLGESIFLGTNTVDCSIIPTLSPDAIRFIAEVIESRVKPSRLLGTRGKNAFGEKIVISDRGNIRRAIIGVGRQDVVVDGLTPHQSFEILGASSDHVILDTKNMTLKPGNEVEFSPDYGAMLAAMTSPYVYKKYVRSEMKSEKVTSGQSMVYKSKVNHIS